MTKLVLYRNDEETWREAAIRQAKKHGLEWEVEEAYNEAVNSGVQEDRAAFSACFMWDCLDIQRDS